VRNRNGSLHDVVNELFASGEVTDAKLEAALPLMPQEARIEAILRKYLAGTVSRAYDGDTPANIVDAKMARSLIGRLRPWLVSDQDLAKLRSDSATLAERTRQLLDVEMELQDVQAKGDVTGETSPMTKQDDQEKPSEGMIAEAIRGSKNSPCRSKRGVVIYGEGKPVFARWNWKPGGCDGSAACKATCNQTAVHAEQQALVHAGRWSNGAEMLHVKTVDGALVPSGGPSCVQCSKLVVAAGIAGVWLFHADGWRRYVADEFHRLSILAAEAALATSCKEREQVQKEHDELLARMDRQTS
jgi:deoxycytidylate deaminase